MSAEDKRQPISHADGAAVPCAQGNRETGTSTEKKSVCDGCRREYIGCRFDCKERERERKEAIKQRGEYFAIKAEIGKHRTNYRLFTGGQNGR